MRVMVAEDEDLVRDHLSDLLAQAGCEVVSKHCDGESAMRWLKDHSGDIDAMFLDIRMPRLTGLEVAAWSGGKIPTVFITGYADHAIKAFEVSAVDYLLKPVTLERLARTLDRLEELSETPWKEKTTPLVHVRAGRSREGILGLDVVDVFEVEDREVFAWSEGKRHLALGFRTLKEVEKTFPEIKFIRDGRNRLTR
jgi:two-component system response regulator AlgR